MILAPILLCAAVVVLPAVCWLVAALVRWSAPRADARDARWCAE